MPKAGTGRLSRFYPFVNERLLMKKICMHCGSTNAWAAVRCRKCRRKELRRKSLGEGRK